MAGRIIMGFVAGFVATLLFHQGAVAVLHAAGVLPFPPWPLRAVPPFGVWQVVSLAFWGGVWGIALALLAPRLGRGGGYWLGAAVFGAVLPTLVYILLVGPQRGVPIATGFAMPRLLMGGLLNGIWGLGAALILRLRIG